MVDQPQLAVLMVCLGNICRSPTAEAVLRTKLDAAGIGGRVRVDSAGTYAGHAGEPPDERAQGHARRRGYAMSAQRARGLSREDFERFDLILAMDRQNLADLERRCPTAARAKLALLMAYGMGHRRQAEVPDPYSGGAAGFESVLDLVEDACDGLVAELASRLAGGTLPR
jgi:protein-tyrosine phosphatase